MMNKEEILNEISNFCEECPSKDNCPEDDCVLYRIENVLTRKTYSVEIQETSAKIIDIEADSEEDALFIVEEKYKNEEIILDDSCFIDYEIKIFEGD